MAEEGSYTIRIAGRWSLEDLYVFPRTYEQVYFAIYSLSPRDRLSDHEEERIAYTYRAFPWQGGYSAVNFYNQLKYAALRNHRPRVLSIEYHSPGWLELGLVVAIALNIEKIIKAVCGSLEAMNKTYSEIVKGMQERKLLRLKTEEIELNHRQLRFVEEAAQELAEMLGVADIHEINDRTGHPYRSLKILMSLYRRIRTLAPC